MWCSFFQHLLHRLQLIHFLSLSMHFNRAAPDLINSRNKVLHQIQSVNKNNRIKSKNASKRTKKNIALDNRFRDYHHNNFFFCFTFTAQCGEIIFLLRLHCLVWFQCEQHRMCKKQIPKISKRTANASENGIFGYRGRLLLSIN